MNARPKVFRWSLLTLMLTIALIGAGLGLYVWMTPRDEGAARAAWLKEHGFVVGTIQGPNSQTVIHRLQFPTKDFPKLGPGGKVVLTPEMLEKIQQCEHLEFIDLPHSSITTADLLRLPNFAELEVLKVSHTAIDDRALPPLAGSADLFILEARKTDITDAGVAHLATCTRLTHLDLSGSKATSACLKHLAGVKSLRQISLNECPIDPQDLAVVESMQLDTLNVSCKPSKLPIDALLRSTLVTVVLHWQQPLDDEDQAVIDAFQKSDPKRAMSVFDVYNPG
ncbi:hypothetical protein AB1L30_14090 [Bremerella sp. JC817]|uniref:hypothetical protein n=1 Tax=Bremerella sp. JC817 TaxID=3231756 RepID=UPI003458A56F